MTPIILALQMPPSANIYWRTRVAGNRAITYVSKEANAFKAHVAAVMAGACIRKPIPGRVKVELWMYPHRPQDFAKRQRTMGSEWDDSVRSLDLDNIIKITLDSLKGLAFDDDVWVRSIIAQRCEPDAKGSRVVVRITPIAIQQPQENLL